MKARFLKSFNENFAVRIFIASASLIAILSFSFITLFIQHESKSIKDSLVNKGTLLAGILAQSTRIGVFSENEKLLEDPMEGVFQQQEVLAVSVFNLSGDRLKTRQKPDLLHGAQTTGDPAGSGPDGVLSLDISDGYERHLSQGSTVLLGEALPNLLPVNPIDTLRVGWGGTPITVLPEPYRTGPPEVPGMHTLNVAYTYTDTLEATSHHTFYVMTPGTIKLCYHFPSS